MILFELYILENMFLFFKIIKTNLFELINKDFKKMFEISFKYFQIFHSIKFIQIKTILTILEIIYITKK